MIHGDVLGERARLSPDKTALVLIQSGERLTYAELDERARRCAQAWRQKLGLEKGERVGILAHNRVEYLDAFFAAGKSGVVLVTLGTRLTAHELQHIVDDQYGFTIALVFVHRNVCFHRRYLLIGRGKIQ